MTFPFAVLNHMANSRRTYQWVNGRIYDVGGARSIGRTAAQEDQPPKHKKPASMGVQNALLVFTMSSVLMVFAGLGLFAFLFAAYAILF
jgi:hypothetical protein